MPGLRYRQIHLDFHTSEHIQGVGKDFKKEEFVQTLKAASVNSITCFAKCHHGMLYYNTAAEARHPYLMCDLLEEQVEVCHAHGIKVPIYLSVGIDEFFSSRHTECVEIDSTGRLVPSSPLEAGWKKLCLNTQYVDYVQAQTEEVLDKFGAEVDGLFFDIVVQGQCCCRACISGMLELGMDPENELDRRRYAADVVNRFKTRMTQAIRAKNEHCGILYNSGSGPYIRPGIANYTHVEVESLPTGGWGYDHFPVTARYARNLGLDFLGMTGKFLKSWADFGGFKNQAALEYECYSALALGGRCSVGDQLHPSGKLSSATYKLIKPIYRSVAEKEPWCEGAKPVVEIGVVTPEIFDMAPPPHMNESASGVHRMLKEGHYQYDFLDFEMDFSKYKVVILADEIRLDEHQASIVNDYVAGGGKLLLSYTSGMASEGFDFLVKGMPVRVVGEAQYSPDYLVAEEPIRDGVLDTEHVMYERGFEIAAAPGSKALASVWKPYFERSYKHFCSHFHTPVEGPAGYPGIVANENIVYVGYPIFGMYKRHGARVYRDMLLNSLKLLLPDDERLVATDAPTTADMTLNYQAREDRYVFHALNYVPERRCVEMDTIEEVLPIFDVNVSLCLPDAYKVVEVVGGERLQSVRDGGRLTFRIPKINGHALISISK